LPTSEQTTATGWAGPPLNETKTDFFLTLNVNGSADFSGRVVMERDAGGGADYCWFPGSQYASIQLGQGVWRILPGNAFETVDQLGLGEDQVAYYRVQRPAHGLPLACQVILHQQMTITCPDGTIRDYGAVRRLIITLNVSSIGNSRDGVYMGRRW
jgi:hypothetical protein